MPELPRRSNGETRSNGPYSNPALSDIGRPIREVEAPAPLEVPAPVTAPPVKEPVPA